MTNGSAPAPPGITPAEESSDFWRGAAEHRLRLQRCTACGRHRFPPMPSCPWCGATETAIVDAAGRGTIYSWIVVRRAFDDRFAADIPYAIASIDLTEGCRMFARVEADPAALSPDQPVLAHFVDRDGWTEIRFALVAGAS